VAAAAAAPTAGACSGMAAPGAAAVPVAAGCGGTAGAAAVRAAPAPATFAARPWKRRLLAAVPD
jgi:hypothetical protein